MAETTPMARITVFYWAGAKAAAGVQSEQFDAETVTSALDMARAARADPRFDQVLDASSLLIDGLAIRGEALDRPVTGDVRVEVLPPFAGGAGN